MLATRYRHEKIVKFLGRCPETRWSPLKPRCVDSRNACNFKWRRAVGRVAESSVFWPWVWAPGQEEVCTVRRAEVLPS
jgi:hypothetical protein